MPAYFTERRHLTLGKMGLYTFFSFGATDRTLYLGRHHAQRYSRANQDSRYHRKETAVRHPVPVRADVAGQIAADRKADEPASHQQPAAAWRRDTVDERQAHRT